MAMHAEVIAIGKFSKKVLPNLEGPASLYSNVQENMPIAQNVFFIESGSTESRELASALGIDPYDVSQHHFDGQGVDLTKLTNFFSSEEVETFVRLRDSGFKFFFLPNA